MDIEGNICGYQYEDDKGTKHDDMTEYPYLYYVNVYSTGVCVKNCPAVTDGIDVTTSVGVGGVAGLHKDDYANIGVYDKGDDGAYYTTYDNDKYGDPCDANDVSCFFKSNYGNTGKGYYFPVLDTKPFMNRCSPTANATAALESITDADMNPQEEGTISQMYGDLYDAMTYILGFGFVVAMVISFVYSILLRIPGVLCLMVWGCIGGIMAMFAGTGGYGYLMAEKWRTEEPYMTEHCYEAELKPDATGLITAPDCTDAQNLEYASYIAFALAGLWFFLICFLRARIQLALAVVKQAARSVAAMPMMILFPVLQCAAFVVFMVVWLYYAVYLASLGELSTSGVCSTPTYLTETLCTGAGEKWIVYRSFDYDETTTQMGWYLLFCYFWSSQFIIAVGEIVIAMCVAKWYFIRDKSSVGSGTVLGSIKDSLFYHTGTAAFGSLIIAIIKMIRAAIAYIQKKAKNSGNKLAEAVLCALQCYMWCMEKCMKFLNKNAYIQTAIFGTNFCTSAKNAFFLILRNIARISACSMVADFVVIIGKIFIAVMTAGASYFLMDQAEDLDLNNIHTPVVMVLILSYFTASMFMNVFGMAISTILQCFVADEEMFDASTRYADSELASFIDKNGKENSSGNKV